MEGSLMGRRSGGGGGKGEHCGGERLCDDTAAVDSACRRGMP